MDKQLVEITDFLRRNVAGMDDLTEGMRMINKYKGEGVIVGELSGSDRGYVMLITDSYGNKTLEKVDSSLDDWYCVGHKPTLTSVLSLIDKLTDRNFVYFQDIYTQIHQGRLQFYRGAEWLCDWDLSSNYLEDQNKGMIDFIYGIIQ